MKLLTGDVNIVNLKRLENICKNRHTVMSNLNEKPKIANIVSSLPILEFIRLGKVYTDILLKTLNITWECEIHIIGILENIVIFNSKYQNENEIKAYNANSQIKIKFYNIVKTGEDIIVSEKRIQRSLKLETAVLKENSHTYEITRDLENLNLKDNDTVILKGKIDIDKELNPILDITWIKSDIDIDVIKDIIRKFKGYENIKIYLKINC